MQVEQIDFDAADEHFDVWYPETAWGYEPLAEAFARHRHKARTEVVGEIVAWLEEMYENCESIDGMLTRMNSKDELAKMMQAKFGGRDAD